MLIKITRVVIFIFSFASLFSSEHVYLKTPDLSIENIIGYNVGIRPYRKTGVRLEAEHLQDKLIIHNYGYGGSGLTLSFGGAKEVIEILNNQNINNKTVAILGAGVAGLTTAYDLLEQGYDVHIYSDNWSPNLTSNVAAGIWSPLSMPDDADIAVKHLHQRLLDHSEKRFLKSVGDNPEFDGVRLIWSYSFKAGQSPEAIKTKHQGEKVVAHFDNGVTKKGRKIHEIGIDGKLFMQDLFSKVKSKRAQLHECHFESLADILNLEESIIINCTSMGSRLLFGDQDLVSVRGQIIYFKPQEEFDYLFYQNIPNSTDSWVAIYPWSDRIILGGVYEYDNDDANVNLETLNKIIESAQESLLGEL